MYVKLLFEGRKYFYNLSYLVDFIMRYLPKKQIYTSLWVMYQFGYSKEAEVQTELDI